MEEMTDAKTNAPCSHDPSHGGGRPGWTDWAVAADEILMTVTSAEPYGFPGWSSVVLAGKPIRHFPSVEQAYAYIRGRDRTYSLAELAEACAVTYARGVAMAQVGQHPLSLGLAGTELFPSLSLPSLLASIAWSHQLGEGQSGWEVAEDQSGTALGVLAAREQQWQILLAAVDNMIAWLTSQTSLEWPGSLSRAIDTAAKPLRHGHSSSKVGSVT